MPTATLVPWAPEHLPLLVEANTPEMTRFMGGPEDDDAVRRRHEKYLRSREEGTAWMFAIMADGEPAGGIGFWPVVHDGADAFESGWNVVPRWQGRGVGRKALQALIVRARDQSTADRTHLFAYPSIENEPSNALCLSVGFSDRGEREFPFRGTVLRSRVWALDLSRSVRASGPAGTAER